ncbi:hypothetical protein PISL3812_02502 [Talaromyces islandicus]|uniref:Uncharacterized protein n=1 Tax=Talaromyces islandicus TaxID=28573 RepID=A0A0U1LQ23_TALIS|nr:hypothetical protein PISL3812_02502 [Talaromyces islandicus]
MDDDEEKYRLQQLADLGSFRRDGISTEEEVPNMDRQGLQPEKQHGFGQPFSQPQGQGHHRVFLNAWSNLHSTVGDTEEELDSIMGGQSHRAKLNNGLSHSRVGSKGLPPQQHRNSKPGKSSLRMGYKPVYRGASKPPPAPYYKRTPQTVRPPLTARAPPAVKPSPTVKKSPTPEALPASKPSTIPGPSPTLKELPAPGPQPTSNQGRRKIELTGYNLPQPQMSSAAFQPQRHSEEDLLTFDSPPSRSSRSQSPVKVYQSASTSDLMEIDDGEMATNYFKIGGLQSSKFAPPPSYASTKKRQTSGLMASKYATMDNNPATQGSVGKVKAVEVKYPSSSGEIDFWQEALPRAVKDIIIKAKAEPSPAKKDPSPLSKSRWAD